jgi:hypothetical protein
MRVGFTHRGSGRHDASVSSGDLPGYRPRFRRARHASSRRQLAPAPANPWGDFAPEFERSRRYEHPFALVVWPLSKVISEATPDALAHGNDASIVRIRSVDKAWLVGGSVYLLLPETTRADALMLLARLERESKGFISAASARAVAFPEDGLTAFALIASLREGQPLSELGLLLPPSTNGAKPSHEEPSRVDGRADGVVPTRGLRGLLDRALLKRTRILHDHDRSSALD